MNQQTPPSTAPVLLPPWSEYDAARNFLPQQQLTVNTATSPPESSEEDEPLPPPVSGKALMRTFPDEVEQLIHGLIGVGERLILSGSSKAGKTWSMLSLAAAIQNGHDWLGFPCTQGNVLYLNLELNPPRMAERLKKLGGMEAVNIANLAGKSVDWEKLEGYLDEELARNRYLLIIIDPIYKMGAGVNENDNSQVTEMLSHIHKLSIQHAVAFAFAHHFSKGNKAGTDAIDRASGAGAFARDPDAVVTLTNHKEEGCFVVDCSARNYRRPIQRVFRFEWPHFKEVDLSPSELKKPGRTSKGTPDDVRMLLYGGPLPKKELLEKMKIRFACSLKTAQRRLEEAADFLEEKDGMLSLRDFE